jgi:hypothetical protein
LTMPVTASSWGQYSSCTIGHLGSRWARSSKKLEPSSRRRYPADREPPDGKNRRAPNSPKGAGPREAPRNRRAPNPYVGRGREGVTLL